MNKYICNECLKIYTIENNHCDFCNLSVCNECINYINELAFLTCNTCNYTWCYTDKICKKITDKKVYCYDCEN